MEICKLCLKREATQKNSHIFPRFMGVSMLITAKGLRKGYKITSHNGINRNPFQDTPKDDFILCPECETFFAKKYETPIAKDFYHNRDNPKHFFNVFYVPYQSYRVYHRIDYQLFAKFLYSIIFRASISNLDYFANFHLSGDITNELRRILIDEIAFKEYPTIIIYTPNNPLPSGNFIGAISSTKNVHLLGINEYMIFPDLSNENYLEKFFSHYSISEYKLVRIFTVSYEHWKSIIQGPVFGPVSENLIKRKLIEHIIDNLFVYKWITKGFPIKIYNK